VSRLVRRYSLFIALSLPADERKSGRRGEQDILKELSWQLAVGRSRNLAMDGDQDQVWLFRAFNRCSSVCRRAC
jgi:hypothetical protein